MKGKNASFRRPSPVPYLTPRQALAGPLIAFLMIMCAIHLTAQTDVTAWYADGQVWVVWDAELPLPDWYEIYAKPTPFTSTTEATRVGKLHKLEYGCVMLHDQVALGTTARIPQAGGGVYQLGLTEGVFAFTPHQSGSLYFAVVAEGTTTVTAANLTASATAFTYDPEQDPVACHLQATFPSPFTTGYVCLAYLLWTDGRQNQWENRPDFPVMGNAAKNGCPAFFFVSVPQDLDTTQLFPVSVWLHGGGGTARQSLAGSRQEVNINPELGILVAHEDNTVGWRNPNPPNSTNPTRHFGYRKNYDPFVPQPVETPFDTVVNYTQRRYLWIDSWITREFNADPQRIHIHGHSMGSWGATALAKCYPGHYASCTLMNNGCDELDDTSYPLFGTNEQDFPTNLTNRNGETVRVTNLFNLKDNCAAERDLPLVRVWHSKNDNNGVNHWGPAVVANFRTVDSLGAGMQLMWSERAHGMDTGPDYNDHWIQGVADHLQTEVDNVSFAEALYRRDQSYPAFFNHRLDPRNHDPGQGLLGVNLGDGDNWGTWGGYHRWAAPVETPDSWSMVAWLKGNAVFPNDNCPESALIADLAIRRPKTFTPASGQMIYWQVEDVSSNAVLQSGQTMVESDDLVVIPQVEIYPETSRMVRITVSTLLLDTPKLTAGEANYRLFPNPAPVSAPLQLVVQNPVADARLTVIIYNETGQALQHFELYPGSASATITVPPSAALPAGVYLIRLEQGQWHSVSKWVKL